MMGQSADWTMLGVCLVACLLPCLTTGQQYEAGNGALVHVETEDDDNPVVNRDSAFPKDVYDPNMEPFIPRKEWQTVKNGQAVPPGLHIRMNFQTGVREAKLMDGDDGSRYTKKPSGSDHEGDIHVAGGRDRLNHIDVGNKAHKMVRNDTIFLSLLRQARIKANVTSYEL